MRASSLLPCLLLTFLAACLPTKSEDVSCATNDECGAGFRCDPSKNICVCDGTATDPGCTKYIDGGSSTDAPRDVPAAAPVDAAGAVERPMDLVATDAPADQQATDSAIASSDSDDSRALDAAIDSQASRVPDASGTGTRFCGVILARYSSICH